MEEAKYSPPKSSRICCENNSCSKSRKHYCSDHNQILCNSCFTALHVRCACDEIPDKEDIKECLEVVKSLFRSVHESSDYISARLYIKGFDEELRSFTEKLDKINQNLSNSIDKEMVFEFSSIMKEVLHLQKTFIESRSFTEYTKFKELKHVADGDNLVHCITVNQEKKFKTNELEKLKENVLKGIEEHYSFKIEQEARVLSEKTINDNQKIINDCKETIKLLEIKIKEEKKANNLLTSKNSELINELKNQTKKFENEKQKVFDLIKEEEKMQIEKEEKIYKDEIENKLQKIKDSLILFDKIYMRNMNKQISDFDNFYLKISLKSKNDKALFKDIVTSKLKLPDLKGIRIDYISEENPDLNSFLNDCIPDNIQMLAINYSAYNYTGIKSKFYINSLSRAVSAATTEVYFYCIDFSEEDLQKIIIASCKALKVVFNFCCIHCSSPLDFNSDQSYSTRYISFVYCGDTSYDDRKTSWKKDSSCFENIVNAIGNSGLKNSLQIANITFNDTLSKASVQEMFNTKGMPHVSVYDNTSDWIST